MNGGYKTTGGIPTARPAGQTKRPTRSPGPKEGTAYHHNQNQPNSKNKANPYAPNRALWSVGHKKACGRVPRERNGKKSKRSPKATMPTEEKESRKCPGMNTITRTTRWKQRKAKKSKERRLPSSISKILATDEGLDEVHTVHERAQATSGRTEDKPRRLEKGRGGQSKVEMTGEGPRKVGEKPRGL